MDNLTQILSTFNLAVGKRSPVEIPNANRETLAQLFCALGYKIGVEVGTYKGLYAEMICKHNPGVKLFCVDPYRQYRNHPKAEDINGAFGEARARLADYNAQFVREYSMDVVEDFADNTLDFVYIDGDHEWNAITQDIYWWSRKVRPGGIVAGHDYRRSRWKHSVLHVVEAVNGYTSAYRIHPWFLLGAKSEEHRDNYRSWFWVKQ